MKTTDPSVNQRKLIDKLLSPPHFGPLIGLLATSYEMQPEFFETDFLPSVLGIGAWDDRSWTSRIEIEKKLAYMDSATVFIDASRYRNRPRSLRVKIVPVLMSGGKALHSKIVMLVYENAVRVIVGSANLTHSGYRLNREVVAVLTATRKNTEQGVLIYAALSGISQVLGDWWNGESENLVRRALDLLKEWGLPGRKENEWFFWGGGKDALWSVFLDHWPTSERIKTITIVSPFWSEDEKQITVATFLKTLGDKELLEGETKVNLLTEATPDTQATYKPTLPLSFGMYDFSSLGINVSAQAVDPHVPQEEIGIEGFIKIRPLHAKAVLFEGETTSLVYVGSGNFTRKGWGFLLDPTMANVEAGVIIRKTGEDRKRLCDLIPKTTGPVIKLTGNGGKDLGPPEPKPDYVSWPYFVKEVLLTPNPQELDRLDLVIVVERDTVQGEWKIGAADKNVDEGERNLFSSPSGSEVNETCRIYLEQEVLNALLLEQEVLVHWWASPSAQTFPINVAIEARHALPITPGRHTLSEYHLILYYQSRITWEELFPDPDEPQGNGAGFLTDTDEGVDTSRIQSYQIREFVEALRGILDDLKAAAQATEPAMRLALLGPVSPVALARVIMEAVHRKERSPVAGAFQLVEILACLQNARTYETPKKHKDAWLGYVDETIQNMENFLESFRVRYPDQFQRRSPFVRYEKALRKHYKKITLPA